MKYLNKDGIKFIQEELLSCKKQLETCNKEQLECLQTYIKIYRSLLAKEEVKDGTEELDEDFLGL